MADDGQPSNKIRIVACLLLYIHSSRVQETVAPDEGYYLGLCFKEVRRNQCPTDLGDTQTGPS